MSRLYWMVPLSLFLLFPYATTAGTITDGEVITSDGVRLHYREAGHGAITLFFVPGWLMPAEIFDAQLEGLSVDFRVVSFSPRSQGRSQAYKGLHTAEIRARDINEVIAATVEGPFVLVGWSLGVMEGLDYVWRFRPKNLVGLVLIDNSIGEGSPPKSTRRRNNATTAAKYQERMRAFVRSMFRTPQPESFLAMIDRSTMQVPTDIADELLAKPYPREYYKGVIYRESLPVLYAITPRFREQGAALMDRLPVAQVSIYEDAGHALFVDSAQRFNTELAEFVRGLGR